MTIVHHYVDAVTQLQYFGTLAEMNAMSTSGLSTGDRFFAYDPYLSYRYASGYGWLLWEKHTVT